MLRSFLSPSAYRPHSRFFDRAIFYAPEGDQGQQPTPQQQQPDALTQALSRLQQGDQSALATIVQRQAERIEQLLQQRTPEGATVLTGDQAALWDALKGYKPDEVAKWRTDLEAAQGQLSAVEREKLISKAASAVGYKASVLSQLPGLPAVEVTEKDGKPVAEVVKDGTRTPLADYVTQHYSDFLPALQVQEQKPAGTQWIPQTGSTGNQTVDPVAAFIEQQNKRAAEAPNALARR